MRYSLIAHVLLGLFCASPIGCVRKAEGPSVAVMRHPGTIDAGALGMNQAAQLSFDVRNDGRAPLIISHIETDCQCKAVYIRDNKVAAKNLSIPPGEGVTLALDLMATGSIGAPQQTKLKIHSNDPSQTISELTISYVTTARLYAVPAEISVGGVLPGATPIFIVDLYADEGSPLVTAEPLTTDLPDLFAVKFLPPDTMTPQKLENSYARLIGSLQIQITSALTNESEFMHRLAIKQRGATVLTLPIVVRYQRDYILSPSTVVIPRRTGDFHSYEQSVRCTGSDGQPFTLTAHCSDANIVANVVPGQGDDHSNSITFSCRESARTRPSVTTATIKCVANDGKTTELSIQVRVMLPTS